MSKTFVYDRFDFQIAESDSWATGPVAASDGAWVKAEDAINREAVLQAEIRTLQVQLKDAKAPQWQPIETAPKDGTWLLMTNGKDVAGGQWINDEGGTTEYRDADGRYLGQDDRDGFEGWMDWMGGMPNPTHWMPLPAAPKEAV